MQIKKAFKFELMPTGGHIRKMRQFCGCSRFVFNKALAYQNEQYEADKSFKFGYTKIANLLPEWKAELPWLKDCHSQVLQQSLKDLEAAFRHFFAKRADFPKFKKKGIKDSFRFPQGFKLEQGNNRIFLPKIGWVRYRNSQQVIGAVKNVTVSQKCGKWYVSIQTEFEQEVLPPSGGEVGIDMGIARFATLSNGRYFEAKNSLRAAQQKLAKLQRQMSHKTKFSNNWKKVKTKVSKLHSHIANARRNYLHKISTEISKNHTIVYVEDLKVSNMSKSAKGNNEQYGRMVKQKSGLNRSILDQSWFEFRRQLDYKLLWHGGYLIAVDPRNTSRTCPICGHISKENRQSQTQFECMECGFAANADEVGAINILRAGRARLACEVSGAVRPPAAGTHRSELAEHR
ncbi:IS200/IS605 family element transposase accessory protein TnpB [Pasteurellaceae bacterium USgator11]|nr:IS200/IS605 family element transposase accessory protein TnpB [Pasteurellaceae bacterium UScroc12]TNG97516.1 IS200/IS605 family element transposase accessory protein TnpB [Pasteurellaceae bacterium USgator41]TNG99418.1 IS200/IS605 family element transposase accessory protein TnpB [Pasteurellaceae bacterium UScroc31]TNH00473.1 IS200/IS605 family element transposase accessory protein TnpB [Pasteurellaceae bacterium USgator11]